MPVTECIQSMVRKASEWKNINITEYVVLFSPKVC